jgi:hypothetical protein
MCRIRWAPRLRREKLLELYAAESLGVVDKDLIDDVGWTLYDRCRSVIMVSDASGVWCPRCDELVSPCGPRWTDGDTPLCSICGWSCTYDEWATSWRHRELNGANAISAFRRFVAAWPAEASYRRQIVLIDALIHAFHVGLRGDEGRPAGNNLLEGNVTDVVQLLDAIGDRTFGITELDAHHAAWRTTASELVRRRRQIGR